MAKEFIITEGDIDAALDLLLEYEPVDRYRKLMRFYRDKAGNPNEKAVALKRLQRLKAKNHPELEKYKFPEPPKPKVPATTGTRATAKAGEKKAKAGETLIPTDEPIGAIAHAEMTPTKKKSGDYDVVTIGDKEYDKEALKVALIDVEKKAERLPLALRKTELNKIAIIKKKIETPPEDDKPVEAEVNIHDMSKSAKGYVSVVDDFTWKGGGTSDAVKKMDLSANAGMFMEMAFVGQIIDAVIKAGNSLVVEQNNLESFYAKHVEPALKASFENLTLKLNLMSDSAPDADVTKKLFDEIGAELEEKKKTLEKSPKLTKKFNKVKEEYFELMAKQFAKSFEKEKEALTEEKLLEVIIDFSEIKRKKQHLDESFLVMFGGWVKWLLGKMFSGGSIPGTVKGSRSEVESFARAMASEKGYIETAKRYGLDHPATYKSKARLSSATSGFEKATGIKWPFE